MNGPAWQATVGDLVAPNELSAAVSLNSAAFNLARAVGPALGGVHSCTSRSRHCFPVERAVLHRSAFCPLSLEINGTGKRAPGRAFVGAMRAGIRYVRHAPAVQVVLVRTAAFILFGSAIWALLPLVVKTGMGRGPSTYGVLLGGLGAGALIGAALLPKLKSRTSVDFLIMGASAVFAMVMVGAGMIHNYAVMIMLMLLGGAAWIAVLSSLNVAARMVVPAWVQARSLAFYLLVFQGGTAVGSLVWGALAGRVGVDSTLVAAGIGLLISLVAALLFPLRGVESLNLKPAAHRPAPDLADESVAESGSAFVTVEYRVDPVHAEELCALWVTWSVSVVVTVRCSGAFLSTRPIQGSTWRSFWSSPGSNTCVSMNASLHPITNCRNGSDTCTPVRIRLACHTIFRLAGENRQVGKKGAGLQFCRTFDKI